MSFTPYPNSGDDNNGFYVPEPEKFPTLPSYQSFVNGTLGRIDITTLNAIDNLIKELPFLRSEALQLAGEAVAWLRRKTSGIRCQYYNGYEQECTVSKCTICFGTTFVGGYDPAVILKASFIPGKSDILIEEAGLTVTQRPSAWTIITNPIMAEKDIIVSFANERYEIHSAEAIEHKGYKHYQEITLSRIDSNDVKYYVSVPGIFGNVFNDFSAKIQIRAPYTEFKAVLTIVNPRWVQQ